MGQISPSYGNLRTISIPEAQARSGDVNPSMVRNSITRRLTMVFQQGVGPCTMEILPLIFFPYVSHRFPTPTMPRAMAKGSLVREKR